MGDDAGNMTGRVIADFASQHLLAARLFRGHLERLEDEHRTFGPFFEEVRSYGSAAIMSATAALEALINELFLAHDGRLRAQLADDFELKFWGHKAKGIDGIERMSILDKYQCALAWLDQEPMNEHTSPYRDAWALIELRNALVHYKSTWDPERRRNIELRDVLTGRFQLSPFPDDGADFVSMKCMSAGCGIWATATVVALVREFYLRTNLEPKKLQAFLKLG
jgi:hypothetical protein